MLLRIAGIFAHAALERVTNRHPEAIEDIPSSFDGINPVWLTSVLCRQSPGARVVDFQLGEDESGSTNRRRLTVRYDEAGVAAGLPESLFIKSAMSVANRIASGATSTMIAECEFYNRVRPQLSIEAPVARHAANDFKSCRAVILLDDLVRTRGARFCDPKDYIDLTQARSIVTLLANFHGRFLGRTEMPELGRIPRWEDMMGLIVRVARIHVYGHKGILAAGEAVPAAVRSRSSEIWPATLRSFELGRADPRTLTHGDVHIKNWYVTHTGEFGLADWQCLARGPLTRDLAYAITAALTVADRRSWERELIALYLDRLHAVSGQKLSYDAVHLAYRQQLLSALALWTPVLSPPPYMPAMQPKETSIEYIKRLTSAIDDLDSLRAVA